MTPPLRITSAAFVTIKIGTSLAEGISMTSMLPLALFYRRMAMRSLICPGLARNRRPLSHTLARFHGQWHPFLAPDFQALSDSLLNVFFRLFFRFTLTHAAGDRGTFSDIHAVFILKYIDE